MVHRQSKDEEKGFNMSARVLDTANSDPLSQSAVSAWSRSIDIRMVSTTDRILGLS